MGCSYEIAGVEESGRAEDLEKGQFFRFASDTVYGSEGDLGFATDEGLVNFDRDGEFTDLLDGDNDEEKDRRRGIQVVPIRSGERVTFLID